MVYLNHIKGVTPELLSLIAFNKFKQESILYRDKYGKAELIYQDRTESIGEIGEITEKQAKLMQNYTHFYKENKYMGKLT